MKQSECKSEIKKILTKNEADLFIGALRIKFICEEIASFIHSEFGLEKD